jgi:hypothetical protein
MLEPGLMDHDADDVDLFDAVAREQQAERVDDRLRVLAGVYEDPLAELPVDHGKPAQWSIENREIHRAVKIAAAGDINALFDPDDRERRCDRLGQRVLGARADGVGMLHGERKPTLLALLIAADEVIGDRDFTRCARARQALFDDVVQHRAFVGVFRDVVGPIGFHVRRTGAVEPPV